MARKKAYLVMPRNTKAAEQGLKTGKGTLSFKGKTSMMVGDESLAKEIDTQHGLKGTGDVWVAQDERAESFLRDGGDGVHHYFFGCLDLTRPGGNERVKVKTRDGFTVVSRIIAEEEGLEIIPERGRKRIPKVRNANAGRNAGGTKMKNMPMKNQKMPMKKKKMHTKEMDEMMKRMGIKTNSKKRRNGSR